MPNQISLSGEQLQELNNRIASGGYPAGYRYILSIIENNPDVSDGTKFFFKGAAQVNENALGSDANLFIRSVTESGLAWDGRLASDPEARDAQLQAISDKIAENVFRQINRDEGIPDTSTIVRNDALSAVNDNGQTLGGWGGAFYYWDTPIRDDGTTVGQQIQSDPADYEKFIAVNARAILETVQRNGPSPEQALTAINGELPASVRSAILDRFYDALDGYGFTGNPENIDGYRPIHGGPNGEVTGWRQETRTANADGRPRRLGRALRETQQWHVLGSVGSRKRSTQPTGSAGTAGGRVARMERSDIRGQLPDFADAQSGLRRLRAGPGISGDIISSDTKGALLCGRPAPDFADAQSGLRQEAGGER
jgi:hypothetical protein